MLADETADQREIGIEPSSLVVSSLVGVVGCFSS